MYVCGLMVYDYIYIGYVRIYIVFDVIRCYFEYKGYIVFMVMNFIDIDDKIIKRVNEIGEDLKELVEKFLKYFFEDMKVLKVKLVDIYLCVIEYIQDIIDFIRKFQEKGYVYEGSDGVYFEVRKFKDYGKFSKVKLEDFVKGVCVELGEGKKNFEDFVFWKKVKLGEFKWESFWGEGRFGWYIECFMMSIKYFGESFDIYGGGSDFIFFYYENEIVQMEVCIGYEWVCYWMYMGFFMVNGEKMSKSFGNFVMIREVLECYDLEVIRFFVLQRYYRLLFDYIEEGFEYVKNNFERFYNIFENICVVMERVEIFFKWGEEEFEVYEVIRDGRKKFYDVMDDDFNMVEVFKVVFEVSNVINCYLMQVEKFKESIFRKVWEFFKMVSEVFGIFEDYFREQKVGEEEVLIKFFIDVCVQFRKERKFDFVDKIRDELRNFGIQFEDMLQGIVWKRIKV